MLPLRPGIECRGPGSGPPQGCQLLCSKNAKEVKDESLAGSLLQLLRLRGGALGRRVRLRRLLR
eukprot:7680557-Alexandrium_andersonii.AAC.1